MSVKFISPTLSLNYATDLKDLECADSPAYVHGGNTLPSVGLGVEPFNGVQAAGAVVAPGDVQHAVQHSHAGTAAPTQHVGDRRPRVALFIRKYNTGYNLMMN